MNKAELIDQVAFSTGVSKAIVNKVLSEILSVMTHELSQGKSITLVGFGTFDVSDRKARMGRNPKTGKKMKIPATRVPRFKPGKQLKQAITGS
ncbi:MAG: HU family DNA-binding protein [Cyanobacteria bacterium P01_H01_bin.58]